MAQGPWGKVSQLLLSRRRRCEDCWGGSAVRAGLLPAGFAGSCSPHGAGRGFPAQPQLVATCHGFACSAFSPKDELGTCVLGAPAPVEAALVQRPQDEQVGSSL